jgi:hypothetical protein
MLIGNSAGTKQKQHYSNTSDSAAATAIQHQQAQKSRNNTLLPGYIITSKTAAAALQH